MIFADWKTDFEKFFRHYDLYEGDKRKTKDIIMYFVKQQMEVAKKEGEKEGRELTLIQVKSVLPNKKIPEEDSFDKTYNLALKHVEQNLSLIELKYEKTK